MSKILAALVIIVIAVAAYLNWDTIAQALGASPEGTNSTEPPVFSPPPAPRTRILCLDGTSSISGAFPEAIKASLLSAVEDFLPDKPAVHKDGVPALVGLDLMIRTVDTAPLADGSPFYRVSIPSVEGLPVRPDLGDDEVLGGSYSDWTDAETTWGEHWDAAVAARDAGLELLAAVPTSTSGWSGVTGCMSAAASTGLTGEVAYAIASDLDETVPSESTGTLGGFPVLVIQACPSGSAVECDARFAAFSTWATQRGSGEITRIRPEFEDEGIRSWIGAAS